MGTEDGGADDLRGRGAGGTTTTSGNSQPGVVRQVLPLDWSKQVGSAIDDAQREGLGTGLEMTDAGGLAVTYLAGW